jgi:acetolactate synthase-1/2/3 large subunit
MKYSDLVVDWLSDLGYTHCFFVGGGNIMHLLDGVRSRMRCVPVVHEVAAGIAAEYFNEAKLSGERAFAMVTAGPGLTNIVTAIAGAWLESRELLVLGGQVKSTDLANGSVRQRGVQEIEGTEIVRPITAFSQRIERPVDRATFLDYVERGRTGRKGPVFLEFCLDAQGAPVERADLEKRVGAVPEPLADRLIDSARASATKIASMIRGASRPVFLLGAGVSRATAADLHAALEGAPVALMTTWNGIDRVDAFARNYAGRPNLHGQRRANVLIQQADLVVAFGSRLGMQQTGFNWQQFAPLAQIVQYDIDNAELQKGHPRVDVPLNADANTALREILNLDLGDHREWLDFVAFVKEQLPLQDPRNVTAPGYVNPYRVTAQLSAATTPDDVIIPCSSGGAYVTMMQSYPQKFGQIIINNKGLASMGYGLSAAIGASLAYPERRTVLIEGDGGFSQNLQELATVEINKLNLKIFIFSDEGYASIRGTQRNYFGGAYLGCDPKTGLGFPDWPKLFDAYSIPVMQLGEEGLETPGFSERFNAPGPSAFVVPIDPSQTYHPKLPSRVTASGSMESAPLHLMAPDLPAETAKAVMPYLEARTLEPA